jgi:peroxiredoxin Q/BCP
MKHILQTFAALAGVLTMTNIQYQTDELKVGDPAPNFKLEASDGKTYQLSDFKGKQAVVLAWFPKAFTGGCTLECRSLATNGDKIRQYDVTYFMISTDSIAKNKGFAEKEKADFPILSDPSRETAKAYGVVTKETDSPKRWNFYIDKDGKIAAIEKAVKPATAAEDMIAKLAELGVAKRK